MRSSQPFPMHLSKRCHARSRRTGKPCQAPVVRGWNVCRNHGAGAGAPKGNKNAWKHGRYSAQHIEEARRLRALLKLVKDANRSLRHERT
jgi:glucans biosynthesis protein